jgi:hypothetical protein
MDDFIKAVDSDYVPASGPMLRSVAEYAAVPGAWEPRLKPWLTATQALDGSGQNRCGKYKSAYIRKPFTERQVHAMWESLHQDYAPFGTPKQALIQIDSYGSAINSPPRDTAERHRDSIMKMQYQAYWNRPNDSDPGDEAASVEWIRETYRATFADTGGVPVTGEATDQVTDGCYINYPDTDLSDPQWNRSGEPWSQLYYKDGYPRLRAAKKRWDPLNVFRHKQSVEPAP